jgi:hypothetical protein
MLDNNIKIFILLLLFFYIILVYFIYKYFCFCNKNYNERNLEKFSNFLDVLSGKNPDKKKNKKQNNLISKIEKSIQKKDDKPIEIEKKFIYISEKKRNDIDKNIFNYNFYNKNDNNYMNLYGMFDTTNKVIKMTDNKKNIIGYLVNENYNKYVIKADIFNNKNINAHLVNNFNEVVLNLDNDDKVFYIKKNKSNYDLYLYGKFIGKINNSNNKYKIITYTDYKEYLNLFGIGFILMLKNQ